MTELGAYCQKLAEEIKAKMEPGMVLSFESESTTLHGQEAFDAMFGWGDHQWIADMFGYENKQE